MTEQTAVLPAQTDLRGGPVDHVAPGSPADAAGVRPGDRVLRANGVLLRDAVDFQFHAAEPLVELELLRGGGRRLVTLVKHPDEDAGIEFAEAAFDGIRTCNNNCFFCFLKGLPKGLRKTLYLKDDDYRLSFLHGNFVTLTNLTDADWQRLDEQRLSPLNVSVHASEPDLRRELLGNPRAPDIMEQLRRLAELHIRVHTQVVLTPGVNDGPHLLRTVRDLAELYPTVQTVSVVPVGATQWYEERQRAKHAPQAARCEPAYAAGLIRELLPLQRHYRHELGATVVSIADEYYLAAGLPVPGAAWYDGFPQYENGIGMTRRLLDDWYRVRATLRRTGGLRSPLRRVTVGCAALIAPTLARLARELAALSDVVVDVVPVSNNYFGPRINVSGLLTAGDVLLELRRHELGELVFLPRSSLDYYGRHFLDDGTPEDVQRALGRPTLFAGVLSEVVAALRDTERAVAERRPGANAVTNGRIWSVHEAREG